MTPDEHAAKAAEIAASAKYLYDEEDEAGRDIALSTIAEVQALAAVAQVHATLATRWASTTPVAKESVYTTVTEMQQELQEAERRRHTIHVDTTTPGDITWNCSCDTTDHVTYRGWDPFAAAAGAAARHVPVGEQLTIYAVSIPNPGEGETVA